MALPVIYRQNLLLSGTLSGATQDYAFPEERLSDGFLGLPYPLSGQAVHPAVASGQTNGLSGMIAVSAAGVLSGLSGDVLTTFDPVQVSGATHLIIPRTSDVGALAVQAFVSSGEWANHDMANRRSQLVNAVVSGTGPHVLELRPDVHWVQLSFGTSQAFSAEQAAVLGLTTMLQPSGATTAPVGAKQIRVVLSKWFYPHPMGGARVRHEELLGALISTLIPNGTDKPDALEDMRWGTFGTPLLALQDFQDAVNIPDASAGYWNLTPDAALWAASGEVMPSGVMASQIAGMWVPAGFPVSTLPTLSGACWIEAPGEGRLYWNMFNNNAAGAASGVSGTTGLEDTALADFLPRSIFCPISAAVVSGAADFHPTGYGTKFLSSDWSPFSGPMWYQPSAVLEGWDTVDKVEVYEMALATELVFPRRPAASVIRRIIPQYTRRTVEGGESTSVKMGEELREITYTLIGPRDEFAELESWLEEADSGKPFLFRDDEGNVFWAELPEATHTLDDQAGVVSMMLVIREVASE